MSYETGTATNLADLITKLFTFATANGWTQDQLSTGTGQAAMHRNNTWVSFRWNTTTPLALGLYQALGYVGGNVPGNHTDDSGNGAVSSTSATIAGERSVSDLGNGPFPSYYFFESDFYLHIVAEISTDVFRHFGFGLLDKFGNNWTGGDYCYGEIWGSNTPISASGNVVHLDGLFNDVSTRKKGGTVYCASLPGQAVASKWGEVGGQLSVPGNDRAGNVRVRIKGGFRGGPIARHFACFAAGATSGLVPMYPIGLFYHNVSSTFVYFLGYVKDTRGVNINQFAPKDQIVIGSDTWVVFPTSQKTTSVVTSRSYNQGIAYKKVLV